MVCIVDDDLSVRRAVRRLLRSAGYTVETYGSAREFLDAEPEGRTALALVDVKMEGMTGFDLQEELAARHSAIPIIFITSFDDAATRERIRRTGWECLVKPFDETAASACFIVTWSAVLRSVSQGRRPMLPGPRSSASSRPSRRPGNRQNS
jgi:FixJ family two-component response regulator